METGANLRIFTIVTRRWADNVLKKGLSTQEIYLSSSNHPLSLYFIKRRMESLDPDKTFVYQYLKKFNYDLKPGLSCPVF